MLIHPSRWAIILARMFGQQKLIDKAGKSRTNHQSFYDCTFNAKPPSCRDAKNREWICRARAHRAEAQESLDDGCSRMTHPISR
ncbi:MAG TPA: hypothetical protein PKE45_21675, partial [Caldilineaceae bacterium]|nr:hypothetical protein [Caldilineaceae bacterium]